MQSSQLLRSLVFEASYSLIGQSQHLPDCSHRWEAAGGGRTAPGIREAAPR